MSAQRAKGTSFETLCMGFIQSFVPFARRAGLAGVKDVGDYYIPGESRFIIEAKNVAKMTLAQWWAEAQVEAVNARARHGVVLHKRRGKGRAPEQWVTMTLDAFLDIAYTPPPEGVYFVSAEKRSGPVPILFG